MKMRQYYVVKEYEDYYNFIAGPMTYNEALEVRDNLGYYSYDVVYKEIEVQDWS